MLDATMRRLIDPPLNRTGGWLARLGVHPDAVTLAGLAFGLAGAAAVALGAFWTALTLILASRLADGLDGAVARARHTSDFGGYLDICADFAFYGAVPLGFVLFDPASNGLAGAALIFSFYVNAASFLGFAILAERRRLATSARGIKNLYFSGGLLEGTETIAFFVALCLWPQHFAPLAWVFAGLCLLTALTRILHARRHFADPRR